MRSCGLLALLVTAVFLSASVSRADIFEWEWIDPSDHSLGRQESTTLVPDGAGVIAEPGADLLGLNLSMAWLREADLSDASFGGASLVNADLGLANLTDTSFRNTNLAGTDFTGAVIREATFLSTTDSGFTQSQLYSTLSYQLGDLSGTWFWEENLTGWSFVNQNLTGTYLRNSTLSNVDFSGATIRGATFNSTTDSGFTPGQLYSTASYLEKDLSGIKLRENNLSGWDFSGQNLSNSSFDATDSSGISLSGTNFLNSIIRGANFGGTTLVGFTAAQFYSTASYQQGNLSEINLYYNDLTDWNFTGVDLTNSSFRSATLLNADFSGSDIRYADFSYTTNSGFTEDQLYSTQSFHTGDLSGIELRGNNLSSWSFMGKKLTRADFSSTTITDTFFAEADTRHANFNNVSLTPNTPETHNTIHPDGTVHGLDILPGEAMRFWDYDSETPLPIHVVDEMRVDATGVLRVVIEDDVWGSTLTFESGIDVLLDGTLKLLVEPDEDSTLATLVGTTFELFDWTGVSPSGTFSQITTMEGVLWDTSDLYTTGEVTLLDLPGYLFGDFAEDGLVGGVDFLNWQRGFGTTSDAAGAEGDADGDGDVDRADLNIWKQRYSTNIEVVPGDFNADGTINGIDFLSWQLGSSLLPWSEEELEDWERNLGVTNTPPVASFGFVPEPSSMSMALMLLVSLGVRRTRRLV